MIFHPIGTLQLYKIQWELKKILLDPREAGLQEAFKLLSVFPSPLGLVISYLANIHQTPTIFIDSRPPINWLVGGRTRDAPIPQTLKYILGGYYWRTILTTMESNFVVKLLSSNITWAIIGVSPDHLDPLDQGLSKHQEVGFTPRPKVQFFCFLFCFWDFPGAINK